MPPVNQIGISSSVSYKYISAELLFTKLGEMGSIFGKPLPPPEPKAQPKPGSTVTDKDRAILDLKNARDRLKKYRKKVTSDATLRLRKLCFTVCIS